MWGSGRTAPRWGPQQTEISLSGALPWEEGGRGCRDRDSFRGSPNPPPQMQRRVVRGQGTWAGGHCMARKGLIRGISSTREHFPVETGAVGTQHWISCCLGSCPVSFPPFHPPWASRLGRSNMPVPDNPYLDAALSRRQALSAAGKRALTGSAHGTAPVQTPACSRCSLPRDMCPALPATVPRVPFPPWGHPTPIPLGFPQCSFSHLLPVRKRVG